MVYPNALPHDERNHYRQSGTHCHADPRLDNRLCFRTGITLKCHDGQQREEMN